MKKKLLNVMPAKVRLMKLVLLMVVMAFMFGSIATVSAASGYTIGTFTENYDYYYLSNTPVATITQTVVVYFYTDGKVHIYSDSVSCTIKQSGYSYQIPTPSITNTDGSYSYANCIVKITSPGGATNTVGANVLVVSGDTAPDFFWVG